MSSLVFNDTERSAEYNYIHSPFDRSINNRKSGSTVISTQAPLSLEMWNTRRSHYAWISAKYNKNWRSDKFYQFICSRMRAKEAEERSLTSHIAGRKFTWFLALRRKYEALIIEEQNERREHAVFINRFLPRDDLQVTRVLLRRVFLRHRRIISFLIRAPCMECSNV